MPSQPQEEHKKTDTSWKYSWQLIAYNKNLNIDNSGLSKTLLQLIS